MIKQLNTIYPYSIHLVIGDEKEYKKAYKLLKIPYSEIKAKAYVLPAKYEDSTEICLIALKPDASIYTISHELIHACIFTFDYIGMEINLQTQEAFAYLHQDLFEQVLDLIKN